MSHVPAELLYTKEHEWIRVEGNFAFVGITDFAQHELGDIVFVELPETGDSVSAHQTFGTVESVKTVSDLYAPVTGAISAVNSVLIDHPEKVNEDPYGDGWMLKVELANPDEVKTLLTAEAYSAQING